MKTNSVMYEEVEAWLRFGSPLHLNSFASSYPLPLLPPFWLKLLKPSPSQKLSASRPPEKFYRKHSGTRGGQGSDCVCVCRGSVRAPRARPPGSDA